MGLECTAVRHRLLECHAIEVVNAQGELLRADETLNSDYLWAARGAGAGFFGVVTGFELRTFALPAFIRFSSYAYELEHLETVLRWAMELTPRIPRNMELIIGCYGHDGSGKRATPRVFVNATAFADSELQARQMLELLETCPCAPHAERRRQVAAVTMEERLEMTSRADPDGKRYAADNIYTDASADELVPLMRELFTSLPSAHSHIFWWNWGPLLPLPDMALSIQGEIYLACYSVWDQQSDDAPMERWVVDQMQRSSTWPSAASSTMKTWRGAQRDIFPMRPPRGSSRCECCTIRSTASPRFPNDFGRSRAQCLLRMDRCRCRGFGDRLQLLGADDHHHEPVCRTTVAGNGLDDVTDHARSARGRVVRTDHRAAHRCLVRSHRRAAHRPALVSGRSVYRRLLPQPRFLAPRVLAALRALALLCMGTTQVAFSRIISSWLNRQLGLALGVALAGVGVGSFAWSWLVQEFIDLYGWRMAYVGVAGIIACLTLPALFLLLRDTPASLGLSIDGQASAASFCWTVSSRRAYRRASCWPPLPGSPRWLSAHQARLRCCPRWA